MATITKNRSVSDFLLQHESTDYTVESAVIKNATGGATVTDADLTGMPVVITPGSGVAELCEVGLAGFEETDANGLIVSNVRLSTLAATVSTTQKYAILLRGPATLVEQGLPAADHAGVTWDTLAEIITAFAALDPPIITLDITNLTEAQTT